VNRPGLKPLNLPNISSKQSIISAAFPSLAAHSETCHTSTLTAYLLYRCRIQSRNSRIAVQPGPQSVLCPHLLHPLQADHHRSTTCGQLNHLHLPHLHPISSARSNVISYASQASASQRLGSTCRSVDCDRGREVVHQKPKDREARPCALDSRLRVVDCVRCTPTSTVPYEPWNPPVSRSSSEWTCSTETLAITEGHSRSTSRLVVSQKNTKGGLPVASTF